MPRLGSLMLSIAGARCSKNGVIELTEDAGLGCVLNDDTCAKHLADGEKLF
jgi:hypothetical protein